MNEHSPAIHRKEAAIAAALPDSLPAPSLIGTYDDGDWVALVLADVEDRHPHVPWHAGEILLVLDALLKIALTPVPPELEHLPRLEDGLIDAFRGWSRVRADPPQHCDPWILENLDALEELAGLGLKDLAGRSLVHTDIRADNILITGDGAVLVDWPWASIGSAWMDALTVLVNVVRVFDHSYDVDAVLQSHEAFTSCDADSVNRVLAGLAAYFVDAARQPHPPGLPTVRSVQRQQGHAVIRWLRERLPT